MDPRFERCSPVVQKLIKTYGPKIKKLKHPNKEDYPEYHPIFSRILCQLFYEIDNLSLQTLSELLGISTNEIGRWIKGIPEFKKKYQQAIQHLSIKNLSPEAQEIANRFKDELFQQELTYYISHKKYHPIYCKIIPELMKDGLTIEEVASHLGVTLRKIDDWDRKYLEFREALAIGEARAKAFWLQEGRKGTFGERKINPSMFMYFMINSWGWKNSKEKEEEKLTERPLPEFHFHLYKDE